MPNGINVSLVSQTVRLTVKNPNPPDKKKRKNETTKSKNEREEFGSTFSLVGHSSSIDNSFSAILIMIIIMA